MMAYQSKEVDLSPSHPLCSLTEIVPRHLRRRSQVEQASETLLLELVNRRLKIGISLEPPNYCEI